ncbi:hypothetical protein BN10_140010 [Phycicoccus elongatus Lp2]|uniref:Uncharacterized protein n=1 Tax=Phycicoccus elongatus Lp2 TaxID=1193181 RepID=N0DY50_9MICO|nr:hypothetical protein BN10_140010 [Phycicoccus elongatus Lp2]
MVVGRSGSTVTEDSWDEGGMNGLLKPYKVRFGTVALRRKKWQSREESLCQRASSPRRPSSRQHSPSPTGTASRL